MWLRRIFFFLVHVVSEDIIVLSSDSCEGTPVKKMKQIGTFSCCSVHNNRLVDTFDPTIGGG